MNENIKEYFEMFQLDLEDGIEKFKADLQSVRAGRANPKILDKVMVEYYGQLTPLNQVAGISVPEARLIVISPWDSSTIRAIKKGIEIAEIGLTPNDDGKVIRLALPILTEERRKELVKQVRKMGEEKKVVFRNSRRDVLDECKKMKKDSVITEDDLANAEKDVQKVLDSFIEKIDNLVSVKEKEIFEI